MSWITIVPDVDTLARVAADDFKAIVGEAVRARGLCHVALSGGSTPKALFGELAKHGRDWLPWDQVVLWWGDERTVPPDHADSNYGMAKHYLLDLLLLRVAHRMEGERDPEEAARSYEHMMTHVLGTPPVLDYNLMGMGKDGHTASLFPGSPGLGEGKHFVIANPVDSPLAGGKTTRITITWPTIAAARHTRVLVTGADKADVLASVIEDAPGKYPSQNLHGPDVRWVVDAAAASKLRRRS
jgi:6-phosphogluconolactonase